MKILILVLSCENEPYGKMIATAKNTWDSVHVDGVETIYYCGNKEKQNTEDTIYIPVTEELLNLGYKTLGAFEWAINNKEFDFIARVHSSIYVDKKNLYEYCKKLRKDNLFGGAEAMSMHGFKYQWGGVGFILSRDVVQRIVQAKSLWNHKYMEDESLGIITRGLAIPYYPAYSCAIDKMENDWRIITYNGPGSFNFSDFSDLKHLNHHFYRVKHDGDRNVDEYVMNELFKTTTHEKPND